MCDATTLISSKQTDLHSCWIIYTKSDGKERLTVTEAKPMINNSNEAVGCKDDGDDDDNDSTDQSLHEILEPELQPEPPIPDDAQSQEIYVEHRHLTKEYLRVVTKLYYAQDLKEKLLAQMDPGERQEKQDLLKKMSEKEELLELYNNLKQQLEKIRSTDNSSQNGVQEAAGSGSNEVASDEDWVVVTSNETST